MSLRLARTWATLLLFAAPAVADVDVSHPVSEVRTREADSARWTERVVQNASVTCGTPVATCSEYALVIENQGGNDLICSGAIRWPQPDAHSIDDGAASGIVVKRNSRHVIVLRAAPDAAGMTYESSCISAQMTPPIPAPQADRKCKYRFKQYPRIDQYYPDAARVEDRQGVVYLEFSIPESPGAAADIVVFESSTYADLDAAAIQALGAATFKTNCTDVRYRAGLKFSLTRE